MTKTKKPFASKIINQPRPSESCCWIAANNISASLRFNNVIPMNVKISIIEKTKRLGAIFLNMMGKVYLIRYKNTLFLK